MKIKWIFPIMILTVSLIILFMPAGRITFDKSVSENRMLFQYEIFGCGSLVGKVLDGGEEITSNFNEQYPDIGVDEVVFSKESDEPRKHINSDTFFFDGLAEKYIYVIEGQPVGVTRGAPDCCDPNGFAYNEKVVEFKVDKWYFTSYVPYVLVGDALVMGCIGVGILVSGLWLVCLIARYLYTIVKKQIYRINTGAT